MLKQERKIASIGNCFQDADLLKTYTNADLRAYLIMIAIQVLHNAVESGGVSPFPEKALRRCPRKSITKVCGSTLLALRGCVKFQGKKCCVSLEWLLTKVCCAFRSLEFRDKAAANFPFGIEF